MQLQVHWWPTLWSLFVWVQFESWPSVVFITLASGLEFLFQTSILAQCPLTLTNQDLYTPESQPPVVLNIGLPLDSSWVCPRSSYAWVPASCCPQHRPSPWTLPGLIWDRCHEPCPSVIPQHWLTKTHTLTSESGPSVTPTPAQSRLLLLGACHRGEARAASPDGSLHQS